MTRTFRLARLLGPALGAVASGQTYTVTDLGTLYGQSRAESINAGGTAVGSTIDIIENGSPYRAFRSSGVLRAIAPLPGTLDSHAFAIDDGGRVYGASSTLGRFDARAFAADADDVPFALGDFAARDANAAGVVVGSRSQLDGNGLRYDVACVLSGGVLSTLPGLGGGASAALAIADGGDIVGSASLAGDMTTHAVLWRDGVAHDLGTLGGVRSQALAGNDAGQIAGVSATADGSMHAFVLRVDAAGNVVSRSDLGTLGDRASTALGIDASGRVVGTSNDRAFLWDGSAIIDLNAEISPAAGWVLQGATALNAAGQIVGWGKHNGYPAAFLLTPGCPADLDGDGDADGDDFFTYLDLFAAGDAAADLDGDGDRDADDFFAYLDLFALGC